MLVLASDQLISPVEEFARCVAEAQRIALREHALVTFGVKPTLPSEQYGYVRRGERLPGPPGAPPAFRAGAVQGEAVAGAGGGIHPDRRVLLEQRQFRLARGGHPRSDPPAPARALRRAGENPARDRDCAPAKRSSRANTPR